jgi:hypothetical protein
MKKLFLIALYLFALTVYSQNPTPFDNSIRVKNLATQSGTPDIAVFDNNKVLKKIAWASLPSSVLEYANFAAFPSTGAVAKIYVDKATNIIYRWSGSAYVILSPFTTPTLDQVLTAGNTSDKSIILDEGAGGYRMAMDFGSTSFVIRDNDSGNNAAFSDFGMITRNATNTIFSEYFSGYMQLKTTASSGIANIKGTNLTANRNYELPNASGTIALTSDISNSIAPLEINSTDKTVWNNGKANESTNTSFGEKALKSNTTGSQSTAYGIQALQENTTGELNSAFGANALQNNTTGTRNTAAGSVALYSNTTGSKNTAVGQIALYSNTTGSNNTVVGQDALRSSTTASNNTAMGHEAMYSTTTGADNTAVGKDALENNTTGNENIAIGGSALTFNTTGSGNTAIGRLAGISLTGFNTSPTNSIYIGRNAYALAANQTNQIVIGENTTGAGSNTVTLGNSSITTTRLRGAVQGDSFVKDGGTSSQILMADGSVATAGSGITISSGTISASGGGSATWGGITGTLSSQTDLQNALDLKADQSTTPKTIIRIITPSPPLTITTSETQITSFNFTIPANTFSANDILKVETIAWEKAGTANASSCRLKLSNTNNYAGASNVLILSASTNNINMRGTRTYKIAGGNLKGLMSNSANGIFNDNTLTNVAVSTLALDVTQPIYGFVSLQNSSSADSTIVNELIISKW